MNARDRVLQRCAVGGIYVRKNAKSPWTTPFSPDTFSTHYLKLLDWTGRQWQQEKVGGIPAHLAPILSRIGLDAPGWCDVVRKSAVAAVWKRAPFQERTCGSQLAAKSDGLER